MKFKIFIIFSLTSVIILSTMSQNVFEIHLNSTDAQEIPLEFISNNDDGFAGIVSEEKGSKEYYVYLINSEGNTTRKLFTKADTAFRIVNISYVNSLPTGYLLTGSGYALADGPEKRLTFFIRLDESLNVIWEKVFHFDFYYYGLVQAVMEESNGDLLYSCTPEGQYMFLFRMSANGDSLKFRQYEGDECGSVWSMTYNNDSTNILIHTRGADGPFTPGCEVLILDQNWNQIGIANYTSKFLPPFTAKLLPNGQTLTCGSKLIGMGEQYITAYMLDENLTIQHEFNLNKTDTTSTSASAISVDYYGSNTFIGGVFDLYYHPKRLNDPSWYYIAKVNDTLGVVYEKYIGGDASYWLNSLAASSGGGVLLAGTREELTNDTTQLDGYLIKLDANGCITNLDGNNGVEINEVLVYPNPGTNVLKVRTALKQSVFSLFDETGKLVKIKELNSLVTIIPVNELKSGRYFYSIAIRNIIVESGTWIKANN